MVCLCFVCVCLSVCVKVRVSDVYDVLLWSCVAFSFALSAFHGESSDARDAAPGVCPIYRHAAAAVLVLL